jgi:hypothetical protein
MEAANYSEVYSRFQVRQSEIHNRLAILAGVPLRSIPPRSQRLPERDAAAIVQQISQVHPASPLRRAQRIERLAGHLLDIGVNWRYRRTRREVVQALAQALRSVLSRP